MDKFDHTASAPHYEGAGLQALLGGMELVPMLHLLMKRFDLSLNQLGFASEIDVSALHKILRGEHREFKASNVDSLLDEMERLGKLTNPLEREIWRRELRIAAFSHYDVYKAVEPRLSGITNADERKRLIAKYLRSQYPMLIETYERTRGQFPALIPIEVAIATRLLQEHSTSSPQPSLSWLKDEVSNVRKRAKAFLNINGVANQVLKSLGPNAKSAVPALIEALKDEDSYIRGFGAVMLWKIRPDANDVVPALIEALKDEDPFVRVDVAEALGKIGPDAKSAVPALVQILKDATLQGGTGYSMTAWALCRIGPQSEADVFALFELYKAGKLKSDDFLLAFEYMSIELDTKAIPALTKALKDEDYNLRWAALCALKHIKGITKRLLENYRDEGDLWISFD